MRIENIGPCTLYQVDCLEVLPTLQEIDAVITDPPYGVGLGVVNNQQKNGSHLAKQRYVSYDDTYENFIDVILPRLSMAIKTSRRAAVFTGPHIWEQDKAVSIGGIFSPAAIGRTPWGSKNFLPVLFYGKGPKPGQHRPTVLRSTAVAEKNGHPCPKPLEWMIWLVELATIQNEIVFDPFMGSGTTGVACIKTGRRFIGCEIDPGYFDIACQRVEAALRQPVLLEIE